MYVYLPISIYVRIPSHINICPYTFPYQYMYVYLPISIYVRIPSHINICTYTFPYQYMSVYLPISIYVRIPSHINICPYTFPYQYMSVYLPISIYVRIPSHIQTLLSLLQVARREPEGDHATDLTSFSCPSNVVESSNSVDGTLHTDRPSSYFDTLQL